MTTKKHNMIEADEEHIREMIRVMCKALSELDYPMNGLELSAALMGVSYLFTQQEARK